MAVAASVSSCSGKEQNAGNWGDYRFDPSFGEKLTDVRNPRLFYSELPMAMVSSNPPIQVPIPSHVAPSTVSPLLIEGFHAPFSAF